VFEPADEDLEYPSDYFTFLRELQEYRSVPVVFATLADTESDFVAHAWEEGFSGTNQLGNRYGAYTLLVLLASDTEGEFGSSDSAYALYPPIPGTWILAGTEETDLTLENGEDEVP
jgi:hypothetical protein